MKTISNRLKFLIIVLVFFSCLFVIRSENTFGIYRETLSTNVYLSVAEPSDYVARVNGVLKESLAEAIEAVPRNGKKTKVTLLKNITLSGGIIINSSMYVDLDLGGFTITGGSIGENLFTVRSLGKFEVRNGTINNTGNMLAINVQEYNKVKGTLYIRDGAHIVSTGSVNAISNRGYIYMTGGEVNCSSVQAAINNNENAQIEVSGGRIVTTGTKKSQAIYNYGGIVTISGTAYLQNESSGTDEPRAALHNKIGTMNILGGTIVSKNFNAVVNEDTLTIGDDDGIIDTTTPVLRGKIYGLQGSTATIYDGIFESENNTRAIDVTTITKPNGSSIIDSIVIVNGNSYYSTYLTPPTLSVSFFPENGDSTITINVDSGTAIGNRMPTNPIKSNYYFDGWYDGNTLINDETIVLSSFDAHARWVQSISNATIDSTLSVSRGNYNDIVISGSDLETVTFLSGDNDIAMVDNNGRVTGVNVGNVTITITGTKSGDTRTVMVTVIPAIHTITFLDSDNETVLYTRTAAEGSSLGEAMPANPSKNNYYFDGWYIDGNSLTPFTSSTIVSNGNMNVIARWKVTVGIATITPNPLRIKLGNTGQINMSGPNNELVENVTYSSSNTNIAYSDSNGTIYTEDYGTINITITGQVSGQTATVQVVVHNMNTITFDPDNGSDVTTIEVTNNTPIGANVPSDPTKTNYVFNNWYLYDGNNITTPIDTSSAITHDITYKAVWADSGTVAAIGTSYFTTLQRAIDSVVTTTQTEIRILADILNPSGRTTVSSNKNIVIDGNNHILSCGNGTVSNLLYVDVGELTLKNGTFTCGKSNLATLETNTNGIINIQNGTITNTNNRDAIYNKGTVNVYDGDISSTANIRGVIRNDSNTATINIFGGTITQLATNITDSKGYGAVKVGSGRATITGGTIISNSTNSAAVDSAGTLVIGTKDGTYDTSSPIIQGEQYGINSTTSYSIFDGTIKGKSNNKAVNDYNKINETTGIEDNSQRITGTDGEYYTLYYTIPQTNNFVNFNSNGGIISPSSKDFNLDEATTVSDLSVPIKKSYHSDELYTDQGLTTPFTTLTPTIADTVTNYAKWSFASTYTPATHNVLSDAMVDYYSNVSSWMSADSNDLSNNPNDDANQNNNWDNGHHLFKNSINDVFTNNGCSSCNANNNCDNPSSGAKCDQSVGYNTGLSDNINVYYYENGQKGNLVSYTTSSGGIIYNMIPGVTYLWESASDNTKYGVVTAQSGTRRTLKTDVRNLRDLGGMPVSYTNPSNGQTVNGTIDYGRLYRGAQITTSQGVTDLNKLGITREIDVRANGEGAQNYKLTNYDVGTSANNNYTDVVTTHYLVNPVATTYISDAHLDNYRNIKAALRTIMEYVVFNHDNIFFHSTTGTDRTGTLAYFLEGLLGVSEEDRLRDFELSYFLGLTDRTRFHDSTSWSNTRPRFYSMYRSYRTNTDIYNYFTYESHVPDPNNPNDLTDDELLARFRSELIH